MNIGELKTLLATIPPELDHLQAWIDSDESEGGRPVNDVQLKYAEDCCLDGDEYDDEFVTTFPEDESSSEFTHMLMKMKELGYRWEGEDRFSKQILKFQKRMIIIGRWQTDIFLE